MRHYRPVKPVRLDADGRAAMRAGARDVRSDPLVAEPPLHEGRRDRVDRSSGVGALTRTEGDLVRRRFRGERVGPGDRAAGVPEDEGEAALQVIEEPRHLVSPQTERRAESGGRNGTGGAGQLQDGELSHAVVIRRHPAEPRGDPLGLAADLPPPNERRKRQEPWACPDEERVAHAHCSARIRVHVKCGLPAGDGSVRGTGQREDDVTRRWGPAAPPPRPGRSRGERGQRLTRRDGPPSGPARRRGMRRRAPRSRRAR